MNAQIEFYVEQMEAALMMELIEGNQPNLMKIAQVILASNKAQDLNVRQAYEIVKHDLLGNILH